MQIPHLTMKHTRSSKTILFPQIPCLRQERSSAVQSAINSKKYVQLAYFELVADDWELSYVEVEGTHGPLGELGGDVEAARL
jgi:hypothetical protein